MADSGRHPPPLDVAILQQAAEWFALLRDEGVTEAEHHRWRAWLAAHPDHVRAWRRVESVTEPFAALGETDHLVAVHRALGRVRSAPRRRALKLLGFGAVLALTGRVAEQSLPWRGWVATLAASTADHRTAAGETRSLALEDGSRLWINTASAVDVDYRKHLRRIALRAGEIHIATARDPQPLPRALVVDTPYGRVTALGTRFTVRLDADSSLVTVFEGAVDVAPAGSGEPRVLAAGTQARFRGEGLEAVQAADPARESWSHGVLLADNRRLDDFVAELARYVATPITVAPEIGHLRLVGAFPIARPAQDIPRVLAALEAALPLRVRRLDTRAWRIDPR